MSGWSFKNQLLMIFLYISTQYLPCVPAWGGVQNFVHVKKYIFLTGNFNSCTSSFVNKDIYLYLQPPAERLKAISWRVTKHCLFCHVYHLQKKNAQLITWTFLMIQSVSFASAAFEAFAEVCFSVSSLTKRIAKAIKFLKKMSRIIYFCLKKEKQSFA